MPNTDFNAMLAERGRLLGTDELTFTLGGTTFPCRPILPQALWLQGVTELPDPPSEDPDQFVEAVLHLFEGIVTEDADKLRGEFAAIGDFTLAMQMFSWVVDTYIARPTPPPSDSPGGRQVPTPAKKKAAKRSTSGGRSSSSKRSEKGSAPSAI